jgi:hypothetical protein
LGRSPAKRRQTGQQKDRGHVTTFDREGGSHAIIASANPLFKGAREGGQTSGWPPIGHQYHSASTSAPAGKSVLASAPPPSAATTGYSIGGQSRHAPSGLLHRHGSRHRSRRLLIAPPDFRFLESARAYVDAEWYWCPLGRRSQASTLRSRAVWCDLPGALAPHRQRGIRGDGSHVGNRMSKADLKVRTTTAAATDCDSRA